jgi:predicted DNA binding CopG/RHH family protein
MRPVQYFTPEYLAQCRKMSVKDRLQFLEDFRRLQQRKGPSRSRLISLRVDESLLERFKTKARSLGIPYQTLLKDLMRDYLVVALGPRKTV